MHPCHTSAHTHFKTLSGSNGEKKHNKTLNFIGWEVYKVNTASSFGMCECLSGMICYRYVPFAFTQ